MTVQLLGHEQLAVPPIVVRLLDDEALIALVRRSPADPARWSPLERQAWRQVRDRALRATKCTG